MHKIILYLIFIIWTIVHFYFFEINEILKVPDSFAYLQMSYHFSNFSIEWFWTWWFGFLYSIFISIIGFVTNILNLWGLDPSFYSWKISNIILFIISWIFLYKIAELYLSRVYRYLLLILFFTSSALLHYNSNILSENIYLPLFLWLFLFLHRFCESLSPRNNFVTISKIDIYVKKDSYILNTIIVAAFIAAMYFTRSESFIYLWSIFLVTFYLFLNKEINIKKLLKINLILVVSFFILISPYIYYLNTITWDWWLTNKWSSNLRQANMRWIDKMDDLWFEKAVWELTSDKKQLIAWFAWGLKYDKPSIEWSIKNYLIENPIKTIKRFWTNQKKLYTKNLPKIIIWDAAKKYWDESFRFYKNKFFLVLLLIPLILIIYWAIKLSFNRMLKISEKRLFIPLFLSFFIVASLFFTLFFVLDRYFIIFLPLFLIIMLYWAQELFEKLEIRTLKYIVVSFILIYIYSLGAVNYYESNKLNDEKLQLKKEAWEWINRKYKSTKDILKNSLNKNSENNLNIMERFPIVTYYSWTKNRWITPYTNDLEDIITYAKYNKIDLLVVDTMDFEKYRPWLKILLNDKIKHKWLKLVRKFEDNENKVIIYKID